MLGRSKLAAIALVAMTSAAFAQDLSNPVTTVDTVVGQSNNESYPVEVIGENGETYFCRDEVVDRGDGTNARICRPVVLANSGVAATNNGVAATSLGVNNRALILGAVVVIAAIIAADSASQTSD